MNKMAYLRLLCSISSFLMASSAYAFFPFVTDDTGTQGKGGQQIELDYEFVKEHNDEIDEEGRLFNTATGTSNVFLSTYTYGLTDSVDLFFGVARQTSPLNGWQNTEIGIKWVFAGEQSSGWSAAIKPAVILPVSKGMQDSGLGNAETNYSTTLIGSYLADDYEFHINAGYTSNRNATTQNSESQRTDLWSVSASPVIILNEQWKLGVDVGLETNPGYNSNYQTFGGLGVSYAPIENLQIGLSTYASQAINSKDNGWSYTINVGVTYQF